MRAREIRPCAKYLCRDGIERTVTRVSMGIDGRLAVTWKSTRPREFGGEDLVVFARRVVTLARKR